VKAHFGIEQTEAQQSAGSRDAGRRRELSRIQPPELPRPGHAIEDHPEGFLSVLRFGKLRFPRHPLFLLQQLKVDLRPQRLRELPAIALFPSAIHLGQGIEQGFVNGLPFAQRIEHGNAVGPDGLFPKTHAEAGRSVDADLTRRRQRFAQKELLRIEGIFCPQHGQAYLRLAHEPNGVLFFNPFHEGLNLPEGGFNQDLVKVFEHRFFRG
jgi:hypothetical protein